MASPIVGSNNAAGRIELTRPATEPLVVTLIPSNALFATSRANVTIARGQNRATFALRTEPVITPTTVTLTARMTGSPDASTTFTVTPPALAYLDCEPTKVSGGSHASCKASMDGQVAAGAAPQIALSTSNSQVVSLSASTVTVPSGSRSATFDVYAGDFPQSASAKVSATYAGVTKTSSLTVTPGAISSFGCALSETVAQNGPANPQCSVVGSTFTFVAFVVGLTAPAPPSGYEIPLTFTESDASGKPITLPSLMDLIHMGIKVPAGKTHAFYRLHIVPVESTVVLKVTAKDPITHNAYATNLTVDPPEIMQVRIDGSLNAIPLSGRDVTVYVQFRSQPPANGIAYDVTYSGTTDIKGPARVRIDPADGSLSATFKVRVFPCALNPPCHVSVSLGGKYATATVTP